MRRLTKRERRTNERLLAALEAGTADPVEVFSGYTPDPGRLADWAAFFTPLEVAREVVGIAAPQPGERVLELAAGLGVFVYALLEAGVPPAQIVANEVALEYVDIGRQLSPLVEWHNRSLFTADFWWYRMGQFDLVVGNPPWGRTAGRGCWLTGDLLLAEAGNGKPKASIAEALSLEVPLRCLRPGGRVVFLLPTNAFENSAWSRYEREMAPYEAGRQLTPIEVEFAKTAVQVQVVVAERNDRLFPGQEFEERQAWKPDDVYRQYRAIEAQHPDAIVFFHLGDFYEAFGENAETVARELNLVVTSRSVGEGEPCAQEGLQGERVSLTGVPYHTAEGYVARLAEKGYRVVLAEQVRQSGIVTSHRSGKNTAEDVVEVMTAPKLSQSLPEAAPRVGGRQLSFW